MTTKRLTCFAALVLLLAWPTAAAVIVVDNDAGAPTYTETGVWGSSSSTGYNGGGYRYATVGGANTATWTANLPEAGDIEVFAWYVPGSNRATSARYVISAADGDHAVFINQTGGGLTWESLGTFTFNAGPNTITIDAAGSSGNAVVIADAISFGREIIEPDPPVVEVVAEGVTHYTYTLPTPEVIHVLEFDLADPTLFIDMGFSNGQRNYPIKEPVPQIAARYDSASHEVIGAVNCAYFEAGLGILGFLGTGGNFIQNRPGVPGLQETYGLFGSGAGWAASAIPAASGTAAFADGTQLPLGVLNYPCGGGIALYTTDWGTSTNNNYAGAEVIVENASYPLRPNKELAGVIVDIRTGANAVNNPIPAGGFVLSACAGAEGDLLAHAVVGQQVTVRYAMQPDELNNVHTLATGNVWLVKDGVAYQGATVPDRHPRTAIAWSNTRHWLVTWDGRQAGYSVGASFAEMQEFLINELHVQNAINLDGGGSTTMVIDGAVVNCPSDGATTPCTGTPRAVPNALMLVRRAQPTLFPLLDDFPATGRTLDWDEKFTFNPVTPFDPGDRPATNALQLMNPAGGFETASVGRRNDANYTVEAEIYCAYRPDVATDGFERVGVFARDDGNGNFESTSLGGGNCYALTYDTHDGRVRAGAVLDGAFTDLLEATPLHVTTSGWRTMRIETYGNAIRYRLDGSLIASSTNAWHPSGRCGIGHHEYFATDAHMQGARVRRFQAYSIDLDYDDDGDIDLLDFLFLVYCHTGPGMQYQPGHTCLIMDSDGDRDVDLEDYAAFEQYFTGSNP